MQKFKHGIIHVAEVPDDYEKKRLLHYIHPKVKDLCKYEYVESDSTDWILKRTNVIINASSVGSILGDNPYCSRQEMFEEKVGLSSINMSNDREALDHGKKYETEAASMYSKWRHEPMVKLGLLTWEENNLIGATLDRVTAFSARNVEIKCPLYDVVRQDKTEMTEDYVKYKWPYYWHQMQLQMLVTGLNKTDFIRLGIAPNYYHLLFTVITVTPIWKNVTWWDDHKKSILSFIDEVSNKREQIKIRKNLEREET